ncbi:hypothetical protein [Bradyrhizobium australafricanum]|uniref:hypothetical protein n=1 Tax=Bradyrhizobium australafricanum TaxID=2821406 RepID=UPI001CE2C8D1|nr:hypothetical protein [Bradyrhizobium australafricanum]MCA6102350.1 hypothetical protein [Bradyrhizobium australafricanum]
MSGDFDWNGPDVVLEHQPRTAVFTNDRGQVVIRQEGSLDPDEDVWVFFDPSNALSLCKAVLEAAGLDNIEFVRNCGGLSYEDVELPARPSRAEQMKASRPDINWASAEAEFARFEARQKDDESNSDCRIDPKIRKDRTAAERQRRRREKLRHGKSVTAERDTVTSPPLFQEDTQELALAR